MLILDIQHVEFNHLYILEEQKENHLKLLLKLLQIFFFFFSFFVLENFLLSFMRIDCFNSKLPKSVYDLAMLKGGKKFSKNKSIIKNYNRFYA